MAAVLKNRQLQIPNGFKFELPEIGFKAPPFCSFDVLVNAVLRVVQANPAAAQKHKWPNTREGVELWVDRVNASICERNGWHAYIIKQTDLDPPKFMPPPGAHPVGAVAAGVASLAEWFGSGAAPVDAALAESRAAVCVSCKHNEPGDLGNWFTRAVSESIRRGVGVFKNLNLSTARDEKLGVCSACLCPLKLKVHVPMKHIQGSMDETVWPHLPAFCWMVKEKVSASADTSNAPQSLAK